MHFKGFSVVRSNPLYAKRFGGECSICLSRIYCIKIKSILIGINTYRLSCGHCFHTNCIESALTNHKVCPICQLTVFSPMDRQLFKHVNYDYLKTMEYDRAIIVLREAVRVSNNELLSALAQQIDPSEVIHHYINKRDIAAVGKLMCFTKNINWHRTVNGKTLVDSAIDSKSIAIMNLVASVRFCAQFAHN